MAHWLMKSEPGVYSWDQLVRDELTEWDGVRNPAARLLPSFVTVTCVQAFTGRGAFARIEMASPGQK